MAYQFQNQTYAKAEITDETNTKFTMNGVDGTTDDADAFMQAMNELLGIVGWSVQSAVRVINQDVVEE